MTWRSFWVAFGLIVLGGIGFQMSPLPAIAQQGYVDNCLVVSAPPTYVANTFKAITCNVLGQLNISASIAFTGPLAAGNNHIGSVAVDTALPPGANSIGSVTISGSVPLSGTSDVNVKQVGGSNVATSATGEQKVGVVGNAGAAFDAAGANATAPANEVIAGGVYNATPPSVTDTHASQIQLDAKGNQRMVIMDAAGNARGVNVDSSNNMGVAVAEALPAGTNLLGKVGIDQTTPGTTNAVVPTPGTAGGLSITRLQVANNTTSVAVDASAGQLYGIEAFNNSTAIAYVKLYNAAQGSTTCGSGTPIFSTMIPANSSGAGYISMNTYGLPFSTAITACVTGGYADNDTTNPTASEYIVNFYYR